MILFIILALILVLLTIFMVAVASVFGAGFIIIFADVIICAIIIGFILKRLIKK